MMAVRPLAEQEGFVMFQYIRSVFRDEKGIAPLEYALIAGLIFSAIINAMHVLAPKLTSAFANLGHTLLLHDAGT